MGNCPRKTKQNVCSVFISVCVSLKHLDCCIQSSIPRSAVVEGTLQWLFLNWKIYFHERHEKIKSRTGTALITVSVF